MVLRCHGAMVPWCHGAVLYWCHGVMVGLLRADQEVRWSSCGHGRNQKMPTVGNRWQMWMLEVISLANCEYGEKESLGKAFALAKTFSLPE